MQLQQVMRDNSSLKRRIEAMEADVQRRTDTDRDKFTVRVTATQHSQPAEHHTLNNLQIRPPAVSGYELDSQI